LECLVGVPAPPGIVMVAPLEPPRNAEGVRSEGRVVCVVLGVRTNAANNTSIIKAGAK